MKRKLAMLKMGRILMLAAVLGFVLFSSATAKESDTEMQSIKKAIESLHAELSNLQKELQALRQDMRRVLAELRSLKASQAKPIVKRQPDTHIYEVTIGSSPVLGPKDAPVTIVEFYDFQCPYCIREYPKIKKIVQEYPDKVRVVLKHFPLSFHKKAKPAHATAELAKREGGSEAFWKMHDMIMSHPGKLDITNLQEYAESLKLNLAKFDEVMADEKKIDELLKADISEARKCNVRGTPTILINGLKLFDRSLKGYKTRIDQILTKKK